jgi:hypothetical protein
MNRMMEPSDDFQQHGFEPLLELATILGPRNQGAHVERQQLLVFQAHVAIDDPQRQSLDDRGLADAGLADQHPIVLGAAGRAPGWCGGFPSASAIGSAKHRDRDTRQPGNRTGIQTEL